MSGSLAGEALSNALVTVPSWGLIWADVLVPKPITLARGSQQTLTIAEQSIAVTVASGGAYEGSAMYRLVGGRGKWGATIPRKSYANDAGVKVSGVIGDAASAAGESVADLPTDRLGPHYARMAGPAVDVLNQLAPRNWYQDFAGVVHYGQRAASAYSGKAARVHVDLNGQKIDLATETVAGLVPGVVVDGLAPASDVEFILEAKRLTARIWGGPSPTSRRVTAIHEIVRAMLGPYRYAGAFEFRVVTQSGERLNLQPVRTATGLDSIANVPVRPGVSGARADVTPGELVVVVFLDRDPSRPVVIAHDTAESSAWLPTLLEFGKTGALAIARETDPIQAGPFAGAINPRPGAKVKSV